MLTVNVPERLTGRINEIARFFCQTPEEYLNELIAERIEHDSAYKETDYLAKSKTNKNRLEKAIEDIRTGKYKEHGLIDEDD
jgi:predicted transcriptional regulator